MKIKISVLLLTLAGFACFVPLTVRAIGNDNPTGPTGSHNGEITTACSYDAYTGNGKRVIDDLVVIGAVGAYPLKWTRVLNTRYSSNEGVGSGGWDYSFHWEGWVRFEPNPPPPCYGECTPYEGPDAHVNYPDGRVVDFYQVGATPVYGSSLGSEPGDRLVRDLSDNGWDLKLKDGGRVHFAPTGSIGTVTLVAQKITDPYGQVTTFQRDTAFRLTRITEAGQRYLQINYVQLWITPGGGAGYYGNFIGSVQAYAASGNLTQTVTYNYTPISNNYGTRQYLTRVDYDDTTHAYYSYQSANVGGTAGTFQLIKTCNDVRYAGPMSQIEYQFEAAGASFGVAFGQVKAEKNLNGQIVSQVQYPLFSVGYVPPPGNTALQTRVETRGDGASRTFLYGTGYPGVPPDGTDLGILNTYTDFKNQLTRVTYSPSPVDVPGGGMRTTIKDPLNNTSYVDRDVKSGVVKRVTYSTGDKTVSTYFNDTGLDPVPIYLATYTNERGYTTSYTRHSVTHAITQISYPCAGTICGTETFTYNNLGQVLTHTLTNGGMESFDYDDENSSTQATRGLKVRWTDAVGNITRYQYYTTGPHTDRLYKVTDPRNNVTTYEYNLRGQVTKVIHPDLSFTQSSYNADGTLVWTADENHPGAATDPSQRTRYTYDEYKRVLTVTNPLGKTITTSYALDLGWAQPLLHTTNSAKYIITPSGKNTVFDYDPNFRKIDQVAALGTADEAWTLYEYDAVGNLIKTTDPRGYDTRFGYDERDRKIWMDDPIASDRNSSGHTMNWAYDAAGNKTRETRANGAFRSWDYDSMNRLWHAYDWRTNDPPASYQTTTYTRDAAGNPSNITDTKGAIYKYIYDALNRKTDAIYPIDAAGVARTERFWYDAAGNLAMYKTPGNQYKHFNYVDSYDSRNRLRHTGWSLSPTGMVVDRTIAPEIRTDYDAASRMTQITTDGGVTTVAFGYDDANRKIWEDQTLSGYPTRRVNTPRDDDGNRTSLTAPSYSVTYAYTARDQLKAVNGFATFTYDKSGNMTNRLGQWIYANGADFSYDPLNRASEIEQRNATAVIADSHYQYDSVGREVATWRDEDGNKGERFSYNETDHLTSALYMATNVWTSTPTVPQTQRQYTYDLDQLNWNSMTDNGVVKPFINSAINQYTTVNGQAVTYDNNFNLTSFAGKSFVYNAQNQLVGGSIQATYDGLGRCVKRTVAGVTRLYTYDDWKPILEWDGAGTWVAWNVYGAGPDEILSRSDSGGRHLNYKQDQHGNVVAVLDGSGNLTEKYRYDAYGKPIIMDGSGNVRTATAIANRFLFTGREWIAELGVYYYRHRFYNPDLGRFLQTDPTGFDAGDMNLFRYCGDDPVDRTDPMGLEAHAELIRDYADRDAPGVYILHDNGKVIKSRANENPYFYGSHGVTKGNYTLQQKGTAWGKDGYFPTNQPAITGQAPGLKPGQPNKSYKAPALVHLRGPLNIGRADSRGCTTVSAEAEQATKAAVAREKNVPYSITEKAIPIKRAISLETGAATRGGLGGSQDAQSHQPPPPPTAAQIDLAHQGVGVPSLGAEAVNFAPGKP